jgi:hypothetical protein
MHMDEGSKEAAIIMFASPKAKKNGVVPPTPGLLKGKDEKSMLPGMPEDAEKPDMCEECDGKGCEECDQKGYVESEEEDEMSYGAGEEDSHKKHMKIIAKLVEMMDKE